MESHDPAPPRPTRDWLLIAILIALVLPLRLWLICNTEVAARDSIGYIRYALDFKQHSWKEVLLKYHQHPGYSLMVWWTSIPVVALAGETTPENMQLSCQLVSFFASLVLIVPMYWLGRQFFDARVAFVGTLLYQYLPISAQHLSDGISEPVYLVFLVSGLLFAVRAVRDREVWACQLCGLFTGLAYLTRPEGALILPAFGLVLIAMQIVPSWRCTWRRFLECGIAATTTAAVVGAIYVGATGQFSNKPATNVILQGIDPGTPQVRLGPAQLFAATVSPTDNANLRLAYSGWAVLAEINQGYHYFASIPALLGLCWSFNTLRRHSGFWLLTVYLAIHAAILVMLARTASYVSDRHVMILVLVGSFQVAFGLCEFPRRVLAWLKVEPSSSSFCSPAVWYGALSIVLLTACMPKATQRLHANRAGNHEAGRWLASHVQTGDHVVDDHAWSHFFAGLVFKEGDRPAIPPDVVPTCYVVTTRSRDPLVEANRNQSVLAKDAKVVYAWPEQAEVEKARVVIYAQPRDWEHQRWRKAAP